MAIERIKTTAKDIAERDVQNMYLKMGREEEDKKRKAEQYSQTVAKVKEAHNARFKPLQDILDQISEPFNAIREHYFKDSTVFVIDQYRESRPWMHEERREKEYRDYSYYRALNLVDIKAGRILTLFVTAHEPKKWKKKLRIPSQTTYSIGFQSSPIDWRQKSYREGYFDWQYINEVVEKSRGIDVVDLTPILLRVTNSLSTEVLQEASFRSDLFPLPQKTARIKYDNTPNVLETVEQQMAAVLAYKHLPPGVRYQD